MDKPQLRQKIKEFLAEKPAVVLSTVGKDSAPYSTTIYCLADEELDFYFLSKTETQKVQNIRNNNKVMVVGFDAESQTNIQVSGFASEVKSQAGSQNIFKEILNITRKNSGAEVPPVSKIFAGAYVVFKIKPKQINYSVYNQKDLDMAVFETLEF